MHNPLVPLLGNAPSEPEGMGFTVPPISLVV